MSQFVLYETKKRYFKVFLLLLFVFLSLLGMVFHEFWRDEVRALSIARQANSLFDFPIVLKNEGHPILWYILLNVGYHFIGSTIVLPILSLTFSIGIFYLLLFKSPFPIVISCLIGFGYWCLYSNGINCRNYGIGAFLLLLFVHLKLRHPEALIWHVLILVLAIQTNMYMAIMSVFMSLIVYTDFTQKSVMKSVVLPWIAIGISVLFAFYTTMPNAESNVVSGYDLSSSNLLKLWDVGYGFNDFIFKWFPYKHGFLTFILCICLLPFLKQKKMFLALAASLVFMNFFSLCVRQNYLHHQGVWLYFLIALLWLNYENIKSMMLRKGKFKVVYVIGVLGVIFILVNSFHRGVDSYINDLKMSKSDSRNFAMWLKKHSTNNEVWITEPDYIMEPVIYYTEHPFYIAREKRFNTYVHFTKANDSILYLSQLLSVSDSFNSLGRSTLLILEHKIKSNDSFYTYSMKRFNIEAEAIEKLQTDYLLLDSFKDNYYTDEHYFVYRKKYLKAQANLK